jgi:predicted amidophosphoribosyltransferase
MILFSIVNCDERGGKMALINCVECNHEVSDKASSCPKCGAPISGLGSSADLGENPVSCPFCQKLLHESAITCGHCGAEYGYYDGRSVYSKKSTVINFGIILPVVISIATLFLAPLSIIPAIIFVPIMLIVLLKSMWQLLRGPGWWKTR